MAPDSKSLTVGMATHDDFDGAYFTIQSIRLHHQEILDRLDFLVVDNNPGGPQSVALERLRDRIPGLCYVANRGVRGTAVRDLVFRLAATPWVLCLDSHVLLAPGALSRLLDYLDARPDCLDLLQGPLLDDDLESISTHFDPVWRAGMYGIWASDERGRDPDAAAFEIPMQGLGLFACRRDAWPGLNPRFSGFGGEEGYLHEKFRRRGGRCLCLPFLRWMHRFQRPGGPSYEVSWSDRIRNYLLGLDELDASDEEAVAHFRDLLGRGTADRLVAKVRDEIDSPFHELDAIYCTSPDGRWQAMEHRLLPPGLGQRLRRVSQVEDSVGPAGRALAHRQVLEEARRQELETVLVIDDGAAFVSGAEEIMSRVVEEWQACERDAVRLGSGAAGLPMATGEASAALVRPDRPILPAPATIYHRRAFDQLLGVLPRSADEMVEWLEASGGLDGYLARELEVLESQPPVVTWQSRTSEVGSGLPATGRLRLRPDADVVVLEDSVLVYGMGSGPAASLNPTAGLVVRLIDGERSRDEIVEILQALYPETAGLLESEVEKVLGFLRASDLLES